MELGSYFLFLQEQIKDIIIIVEAVKLLTDEGARACVLGAHWQWWWWCSCIGSGAAAGV